MTQQSPLSPIQNLTAIQRLTALWAFSESGLGGILHAWQMPFTGLIVGGFAVIIISIIAHYSRSHYKEILKSAVIVLVVKIVVSPHTPFPAYVAVSFQAIIGYLLFRFAGLNLFSILVFSIMAMFESALQQLLIFILFFGKSLWSAGNDLVESLFHQLGMQVSNGSGWIIGIYLSIYALGGIVFGFLAYRTRNDLSKPGLPVWPGVAENSSKNNPVKRKGAIRKLMLTLILLTIISVLLFVFAADTNQGWLAVLKTLSWTSAVILAWYLLINPLFTRFIQWALRKKQNRYSRDVSNTLAFLPLLKQISRQAWEKSAEMGRWKRWPRFFFLLLHWTLTCGEVED